MRSGSRDRPRDRLSTTPSPWPRSRPRAAGPRPALPRYAVAVLAVVAVIAARLALDPLLGSHAPLLPFTVAVMLAGWYGGLGPGLLATGLGALAAAYFWLEPLDATRVDVGGDRLALGIFVATGAAISVLNQAVAIARARGEEHARELRRREEANQRILETANEGILTLDPAGRVQFANAAMGAMLGVPADALVGRDARELVAAADLDTGLRRFGALLDGHRTSFELRLVRADGTQVWAHVSSSPIAGPRGEIVGVLGMFTDLTERMRSEAELSRLLDSETRARAEAEAANRAKDDFLAVVSHELRTPLNAMMGWLAMMRSGALDASKTARAVEVIERNARSQAKLIEDLLDVSRMISGKLRIERRDVSLGAVLHSAIETIGPSAVEKDIRIERRFDAGRDVVVGDADRLKQVFVNLLSNAVRFTPRGGRVSVLLERRGDRLAIEVEDSGEGIAREFLPHVFDRFRQQEGGMTRKHAGLGLGLAIVRHLVELHGGDVRAASAGPGQGACFTVLLPAAPVAAVSAATAEGTRAPVLASRAGRSEGAASSVVPLAGRRVLVVDDEHDSLEMLAELLSRCGAEVRTADAAAAALEVLDAWRPDLIVTDLAMPGQDGYEMVRRIRADDGERGRVTPTIALTAHARPADRARVLASGFQGYLAKPVEPGRLIATACEVLARGSSRPLRA